MINVISFLIRYGLFDEINIIQLSYVNKNFNSAYKQYIKSLHIYEFYPALTDICQNNKIITYHKFQQHISNYARDNCSHIWDNITYSQHPYLIKQGFNLALQYFGRDTDRILDDAWRKHNIIFVQIFCSYLISNPIDLQKYFGPSNKRYHLAIMNRKYMIDAYQNHTLHLLVDVLYKHPLCIQFMEDITLYLFEVATNQEIPNREDGFQHLNTFISKNGKLYTSPHSLLCHLFYKAIIFDCHHLIRIYEYTVSCTCTYMEVTYDDYNQLSGETKKLIQKYIEPNQNEIPNPFTIFINHRERLINDVEYFSNWQTLTLPEVRTICYTTTNPEIVRLALTYTTLDIFSLNPFIFRDTNMLLDYVNLLSSDQCSKLLCDRESLTPDRLNLILQHLKTITTSEPI